MSNLFKPNSRFAALAEDIEKPIKKEEKKEKKEKKNEIKKETVPKENNFLREESNSFKRDYPRRENRYESKEDREERIKRENLKREEENKKKKEEEAKKNLAEDNFPEFSKKVITSNNQINAISYMEKTSKKSQKEVEQMVEQVVENTVKPGWVEIKRSKGNHGKLIYTYGPGTSESNIIEKPDNTINDTSEHQVLEALVNLHNKRTQEYIDMWGYDTWEKMFRFQNYDYEYFDKLDAEYETEEENDMEDEYN